MYAFHPESTSTFLYMNHAQRTTPQLSLMKGLTSKHQL